MQLKIYSNTPDWETSLSIFLFVELVINKKDYRQVTIEVYKLFELKDTHILSYNAFVSSNEKFPFELQNWLTKIDEINSFKENFGIKYHPKVTLWSDRSKTAYFREKLQVSFEFENYLEEFFKTKYNIDLKPYFTPQGQYKEGENAAGIEIKNDSLIQKYGNVYIEYAEKSKAENSTWINSGILKEDKMKYFLIGDKHHFWIFRKSRLIEIYYDEKHRKENAQASERGIKFKQINTSMGFVFPVKEAEKETISIQTLADELRK